VKERNILPDAGTRLTDDAKLNDIVRQGISDLRGRSSQKVWL